MPRIYLNGRSVSRWVVKSSQELAAKKLGQVANWSKEQIGSTLKQWSSQDGQKGTTKAKVVKKPWGIEKLIVKTDRYAMKEIVIEPGHRLSLQYHNEKEETVYVVEGQLLVSDGNQTYVLGVGEYYHVPPKQVHRFASLGNSRCVLLECSTPELDDVVRLADDYNRK